jgi:GAF domain-containing protein
MTPAPHPQEADRIARLRAANILDTPRDHRFDRVIFLLSQILKMPLAAIAFVDADRVWFKARVGITNQEVAREDAFCAHAILQDAPMSVEDARVDQRFAANPQVVGPPYVRSFVGVALMSVDRLPLGCLCAMDRLPRRIAREQIAMLAAMAREAEELLAAPTPPATTMITTTA